MSTDALDFAVAEALGRQAGAQLVDIGRLGEADIHVGAAFEVQAVTNAALMK